MLRPFALLLALLALGPAACDDGSPGDDDADETTRGDGTHGEEATTDDAATSEPLEPTPIPFRPSLQTPCKFTSGARIGNCDR